MDDRVRHGDVEHRRNYRKEEHDDNLAADCALCLLRGHADFQKNLEAAAVIVTLGNLLVVDNQSGREQEYDTEKYSEEKQRSVDGIHLVAHRPDCGPSYPDVIRSVGFLHVIGNRPADFAVCVLFRIVRGDGLLIRNLNQIHVRNAVRVSGQVFFNLFADSLQVRYVRKHNSVDVHNRRRADILRKIRQLLC